MVGNLRRLIVGNERADGSLAAGARSECRPQPEITKQKAGRILYQPRRYIAEGTSDLLCPLPARAEEA